MSERWYSVEEVAAHLGVVEDTVRRWIPARHLPAHRIGKLWKFKLSEVDEWVRSGATDESESAAASASRAPAASAIAAARRR